MFPMHVYNHVTERVRQKQIVNSGHSDKVMKLELDNKFKNQERKNLFHKQVERSKGKWKWICQDS